MAAIKSHSLELSSAKDVSPLNEIWLVIATKEKKETIS